MGMPASCDLRCAAHMRKDDHVILRAQIAFAQFLIREVSVRHAVVIERGAHPAFVLRARPGVNVADARHLHLVSLHCGQRRDRHGLQAQVLQLRLQLSRDRRSGIMNEPACNLRPFSSKSSSAASIFTSGIPEPERHQRIVGRVLDDQRRRPRRRSPPSASASAVSSVIGADRAPPCRSPGSPSRCACTAWSSRCRRRGADWPADSSAR